MTTDSPYLKDYDFDYPEDSVATAPVHPRDSSRLLVLDRSTGAVSHRRFSDLPGHLRKGDCLVVNGSKVLPARLPGRKPTGGRVELLLVRELGPGRWEALATGLRPGTRVALDGGGWAEARGYDESSGTWEFVFSTEEVRSLLRSAGLAPLPPYILKRRKRAGAPVVEDRERYQTVYAREEGSVAAPTAGLHFTSALLDEVRARGVSIVEVTLHVGLGTFRPVTVEDSREHRMLAERFSVAPGVPEMLAATRRAGGRVVAVGTTAVRTLETLALRPGTLVGETDLFIRPGHAFRSVDALVTNFHQPRSTPLLLACAFAGKGRLLSAYREAVAGGYRLFSYGDSMLVL